MRLCLVLLALSNFAVAGPLPPFSKAAIEARAPPSTSANYTIGTDTVAALTQLKAVNDSLNEPNLSDNVKTKRDFWSWFKAALKEDGLLKARSSVSNSTFDDSTLGSDPVAALTKLKAIYDSLNEKRTNGSLKAKRDFLQWLKDIFEAPGLKARSSVSTYTLSNNTTNSDPVVVLSHLKAVYGNLNQKRTESGVKVKRDFWKWIKDMFEGPGLKARSFDDHSPIDSNSDNALKPERTCVEVSRSTEPILPRGGSESQGRVLAESCDPTFEARS